MTPLMNKLLRKLKAGDWFTATVRHKTAQGNQMTIHPHWNVFEMDLGETVLGPFQIPNKEDIKDDSIHVGHRIFLCRWFTIRKCDECG